MKFLIKIATLICIAGIFIILGIKMPSRSLKEYEKKRDFSKTNEPSPSKPKKPSKEPIFVIQKHDASRLHYDLRLEIEGVLVSWAVPKGPSLDPSVKRLAIMTEDHPMSYGNFEGVIPEGQYGAGPVMVWDTGTYENLKAKVASMETCLKDGVIEIFFNGHKIKGAYALVRTGTKESKNWLLIKKDDEYASKKKKPVNTENKSVLTDRTMHQIEKSEDYYDG